LPDVGFLKLKKGSRAIDKGEDLGFPFVGEAPDLGAFEYGMSSSRHSGLDPESSSSAESAASIAMPRNGYLPGLYATRGAALVFDLQGRHIRTIKVPGTYIVRSGSEIRKVQVNP
jgi:hypothetical protein